MAERKLHGVMGEFETAEAVVRAAQRARDCGFVRIEAYTPFPVEGLAEAIGFKRTWIPLLVLGAGVSGAVVGFGFQVYASVVDYPLNIGGRPLFSWPAFIPVTFELTVLFAGLTALLAMLVLNRLPRLSHPVFEAPNFERASQDRFFLCIEAVKEEFDAAAAAEFLRSQGATSVAEVPS